MLARDQEHVLLERCKSVAFVTDGVALNACEANVFLFAASLLPSRLHTCSANLSAASARYFKQHPGEQVTAPDLVRNKWIISFPRFGDLLLKTLDCTV
jgi:hypothetical protein